jgi:predicted nucleic acid-binding Zn ribbon protein
MTVKSLAESLQELFTELGHAKKIKQVEILQKWPEIVGAQISAITIAEQIRDDVLYVRVKSMTWKSELVLRKQELLSRIAESVGKNILSDIRFTI